MPTSSERRNGSDRRSASRGGRRSYDTPGTAPLVLVIGDGRQPEQETETILARLNFAVAPAASFADAQRIIGSLRPDLIVARADDAARLRRDAAIEVPVVESGDDAREADALVGRIRDALRQSSDRS